MEKKEASSPTPRHRPAPRRPIPPSVAPTSCSPAPCVFTAGAICLRRRNYESQTSECDSVCMLLFRKPCLQHPPTITTSEDLANAPTEVASVKRTRTEKNFGKSSKKAGLISPLLLTPRATATGPSVSRITSEPATRNGCLRPARRTVSHNSTAESLPGKHACKSLPLTIHVALSMS